MRPGWAGSESNWKAEGLNLGLLPLSCGPDQTIGDYTEPEIHYEAPIQLKGLVAWQMKGWSEEKIEKIAENDGAKSLD